MKNISRKENIKMQIKCSCDRKSFKKNASTAFGVRYRHQTVSGDASRADIRFRKGHRDNWVQIPHCTDENTNVETVIEFSR